MIKPIGGVDETNQGFIVTDIENEPSGAVIGIDTCWRENGDLVHASCEDWATYWDWLIERAEHDKRFRTIYAHNGGGWDWISLIEWLTNRPIKQEIHIVSVGSKIIFMMVVMKKEFTIRFCDSMQLLRSGLDSLGKSFFGEGKLDRKRKMPHELKAENPVLFWEYVKQDTELCVRVLEKSLDLIREHIAPIAGLGVTIGSTAMNVFKHTIDREISIPDESNVQSFLRKGYRGGRVEVFKYGYHPSIRVYDINSLYPSVMAKYKYPVSADGYWCKKLTLEKSAVWNIEFKQRNRDIPPVLMIDGSGVYEGSGHFYSPELQLLTEVDPKCEIRLKLGYCFRESGDLFSGWVSKLYQLRLDYPDSAISLLCKYLLNSCYGKFGQKSERETIRVCQSFEELLELAENGKVRIIDDDKLIVAEGKYVKCTHEHVGIAGMITSHARAELYKGMIHAGNQLVYCDTDSVHTSGDLPDILVHRGLGGFKLEFDGEGVYVGRKTYGLRDTGAGPNYCHFPREKIRAKGIRVGRIRGRKLNFDCLREISAGAKIGFEFDVTATPLEVMRGKKKSCSFGSESLTRKRRVQIT